jgi:hypothetical protein
MVGERRSARLLWQKAVRQHNVNRWAEMSVLISRAFVTVMSLVLVTACGGVVASPAATPGPAEVSDTEDRYRLVLTLAATTVPASEPVTGEAVLTTTDGLDADISGSGGGVFGFSYREIGGTRSMGYAMTADCAPHTIPAEGGLRSWLEPSGAWSEGDPDADFYRAFAHGPDADFYRAFAHGPDVRLPAGAWQVTAHAVFVGAGCTLPERTLEASTVVVVTP